MKYHYEVMAQVEIDGEHQNHFAITKQLCKRKLKRYLRYIWKYKATNFKMKFIHVFRCDENRKMLPNQYIRFVFNKKDISNINY